jgi:molecular chaperone DnaK
MVKQAEQFADADKKKREEIEVRNQAETAIYSVKKSLDELGDKVSNDERAKVEAAIGDLETANKSGNTEDIKKKLEALYKAMEPISQKVYQQAGAQQGGCGCGGAEQQQQQQQQQQSREGEAKKADGDFVDADYKIVDDQ